MSEHAAPTRQPTTPEPGSKNEVALQRKCACGQHTPGGMECGDCRKTRTSLQRWSANRQPPAAMVHAHLRPDRNASPRSDLDPLEPDPVHLRAHTEGPVKRSAVVYARHRSPGASPAPQPVAADAGPERRHPVPDGRLPTRDLRAADSRANEAPQLPVGQATAAPDSIATNAVANSGAATPPAAVTAAPSATPAAASSIAAPARRTARPGHSVEATDERPDLEEREFEGEEESLRLPRRFFLVDDGVEDPRPGQMLRLKFLAQLEGDVTRAADEALADTGRTTDGCPYLRFWFAYYRRQSSRHIERALHRYAPEAARVTDAADYIPLVVERVRTAVANWARTGEITDIPADLPARQPATAVMPRRGVTRRSSHVFGPVLLKAREGGARTADDPETMKAQLGDGRPLDGGVRKRMEGAFGRTLGPVHVHTDATASRLAANVNARAFTVGSHVAFAAGQYRPGTLAGDALIAHELAHVVQQQDASDTVALREANGPGYRALEADADRTAASALVALWDGARDAPGAIRNAVPSLRSGLRLQRCGTFSEYSSEEYQGYDASPSPDGLVVPVGGSRRVEVSDKDELTLVSNDPGVVTVDATTPRDGMTVRGVSHGYTSIEARKGTEVEERLDVSSKRRRPLTVDYHFMSDGAGHATTRQSGDERTMTGNLNTVWERQANVRFNTGTVDSPQVMQDLGSSISASRSTDPEWRAITAFATGGDYNVFLVWRFDVAAVRSEFSDVDAGTANGNTIMEDDTCNERLVLAHEAGHFMGLAPNNNHPSSGLMATCGRISPRVYRADADAVNP